MKLKRKNINKVNEEKLIKEKLIKEIEYLAYWLDDRFKIPGTNWGIGLDSLVGLIPILGDIATFIISFYIVLKARQVNLPIYKLCVMLGNIILDLFLGGIPIIGFFFDVFWKANKRNLNILRQHLSENEMKAVNCNYKCNI